MKLIRQTGGEYDLDEFLARPLLAHLSTASSEEGARASVFWYLWENGAFWMIVEVGYNTAHLRAQKDPRVALAITEFDAVHGTIRHVGVRGRAEVEPWDDARAARLHDRYYQHLSGYVAHPFRAGDKVTGRLPMEWLKVVPESVVLRGWDYKDDVVRGSTDA